MFTDCEKIAGLCMECLKFNVVGKFEFFNLKKILEKNLTKIQEYFLSYNNLLLMSHINPIRYFQLIRFL